MGEFFYTAQGFVTSANKWTATLAQFNIPEAGLLLILAVVWPAARERIGIFGPLLALVPQVEFDLAAALVPRAGRGADAADGARRSSAASRWT